MTGLGRGLGHLLYYTSLTVDLGGAPLAPSLPDNSVPPLPPFLSRPPLICANVLSLKVVFPIPHTLTLFSYYSRKHVCACNWATLFYSKNVCTPPPPPPPPYTHIQMDASTMAVSARPLSYDAMFRIEVSLSSRKSSAIVMRTTARLYTLEGTPSMMGGTGGRLL